MGDKPALQDFFLCMGHGEHELLGLKGTVLAIRTTITVLRSKFLIPVRFVSTAKPHRPYPTARARGPLSQPLPSSPPSDGNQRFLVDGAVPATGQTNLF